LQPEQAGDKKRRRRPRKKKTANQTSSEAAGAGEAPANDAGVSESLD